MKYIRIISTFLSACLLVLQLDCSPFKKASLSPFLVHLQMLQELKARLNPITINASLKKIEPTLTQTQAYLQVYKQEVKDTFDADLNTHKVLIDTVMAKEQELSKTHYAFYHAHNRAFIILQDFMKLLHEYLRIIKVSDFVPLRLKNVHAVAGVNNAEGYLDAHSDIDDHDEKTRSHMICVNLSLFGNHDSLGECTFYYFISDKSISHASLSDRLKPIFSHYGFNESYIAQLTHLITYLESSTGNLLQIFIPHDMVDDLLYLSRPIGIPYQNVILNGQEYNCREKSMHSLLDYMCTNPHVIQDLNAWQARLLFFDPLLDVDPKIKMFRYNTVSDKNMRKYQQKMRKIVARIVIEYIKIINDQHQEPLMKLYRYMAMNK